MGFSAKLIKWYKRHKRDLPFRKTNDPYRIWLSEIIMQQTRMAQGVPYYKNFIRLFPTVHHLARASSDKVMRAWQGLGYYSRARNLHHTARYISKDHGGRFPSGYEALRELKGVGDYTAAAISSIAFGEPRAVIDGNVYRVLSRYFGIRIPADSTMGKKKFLALALREIDRRRPGIYNQAIMEFGALQCVPKNPDCNRCMLKNECAARRKGWVDQLPLRSKKTKIRIRHLNYFLVRQFPDAPFGKGKVWMQQRMGNDIWKGLYELPLFESDRAIREMNKTGVGPCLARYTHMLSHQKIYVAFWAARKFLSDWKMPGMMAMQVHENQIHRLALARPTTRFLSEFFGANFR